MRIVLALVLALVLQCATALGQTLRFADPLPFDHPSVQSVRYIGQVLRERTNGRLYLGEVETDVPHSESFLVAQVRTGRLDMARVSLNALNGIAPLSVIPTVPFAFASKARQQHALGGRLGQELLASLEPAGLVGLALYDSGTYSFFSRTGFIRTVGDLKGKRIRLQKGDTSEAMYRMLGAEPVIMPHSQIFRAFQVGLIDVAEGSLSDYVAFKYYSVAPYFTLSQHMDPPSVLIMSREKWISLSPQDQARLREAATASMTLQRALMNDYEARAQAEAAMTGARFSKDFDRQSFRSAFASLYPLTLRERRPLDWLNQLATDELPVEPSGPACSTRLC